MLPYVQWSYGSATNLHLVGASAGTPPVASSTGVRQGDTLGTFLFALTLQHALELTRDAAPSVAIVAIADDVNMVGRADALSTAFATLTGGAAAVGLRVQAAKCAATAGQPQETARLAAALGVQHQPDGVTVCGSPIGTDAYVAGVLGQRVADIKAQVDKLMRLPLLKQSQFVLLRTSLSARMHHLLRTTPWAQLEAATQEMERAICDAVATIFRLPEQGGARARKQMTLPLRHAGFGLGAVQAVEADAALLSGAARAQAAMQDGPVACQPFSGAARPALLAAWHGVHAFGDASSEWGPGALELPSQFVADDLPIMQTVISRLVGDQAGVAFLAECVMTTAAGERNTAGEREAARIRSAANGPASAWITAVPVAITTRLPDADFVMAGRHLLGLGVPTSIALPPCECGSPDSLLPEHPPACKCNAGHNTMRHNLVTSVWRRKMQQAGCATSLEPMYNGLVTGNAGNARGGDAGQRRGDILCVMPDGRVVVLDCVVTHPTAASYVKHASRETGWAAARAEREKKQKFDAFGQGAAFDFCPLAMESYGRLGVQASRFLSALGDLAASGGGVSKAMFVRQARQELSCALCRGISNTYYNAVHKVINRTSRKHQKQPERQETQQERQGP